MPKSFPFFRQQSEMDCGASCLRMISRYHNRYYSLAYLKGLTAMSREGVSLLDLSEAAEKIGMRSLAARITYEQLKDEVPLPCIAFWQGYHFVVVYEVGKNTVTIADPAIGIRKLPKEEFMEGWADEESQGQLSGIVLLLETTPEFLEKEEKTGERTGFRFIWQYLQKHKRLLIQLFIGLFFGSLLQLAMPFIIMAIVDVGVGNDNPGFVWLVVGAMIILFVSHASVEFIRGWLLRHIGMHFNIRLLTDFLVKMMKLPMRFFDSHTIGDLMQRIYDNERLERFLSSSGLFSFLSILNLVLFSLVLLAFDWVIFIIFVAGSAGYVLWMWLFMRRRRELDFRKFEQSAISQNYLLDIIRGMQDIKLNVAERQRRWIWEKIQARLFRIHNKLLSTELWQRRGAFFLNELKNIIIIALAAQQVIEGDMTLGMMFATLYILGQLNAPVNQLVEFAREMQEASISLERMGEIHEMEEEGGVKDSITVLPENDDILVEDLSFKYPGAANPLILENLNFAIPQGKTTAIVGSSGSGKTTLIKLLLGIYPPTEGTIRMGDTSLTHISMKAWRKRTAAVMHNSHIFADTLARNIALADEVIDSELLLNAVKVTQLQPFIDSLPSDFNTQISEEASRLNQGARQRILLARAIYSQPDFLFLDEATNGLDAYSEMIIMENLKKSLAGKTLVIVAHRLSTIAFADRIVFLENGEIVEAGTHSSLLEKKGAYYHLVKRQMNPDT